MLVCTHTRLRKYELPECPAQSKHGANGHRGDTTIDGIAAVVKLSRYIHTYIYETENNIT